MAEWDSGGFTATKLPSSIKQKKWEGEDEEEDVKDSWDQDPEEEERPPPPPPETKPVSKKSEEKKRRKEEKVEEPPLDLSQLTPEELQEDADLDLAKEVFGVSLLETKEDYDKFRDEIVKKIDDATKNSYFTTFTEELIHFLCLHLRSPDLKKIHTWVGNLHIEKTKIEKGEKSKKSKSKGKVKLKMEGDNDFTSEYSAYTEDFDDFI
ncbi:hypothetical protein AAG570_005704 [Ranatra chinensis]|uniref:EIF3j n=1 Tax=Ranatra chinensis TaxID=642074 RepID=A0ABD0YGK6_9HEMI